MKKWIVTAVDKSDTCDGKARVVKVCSSKAEAKNYVHSDIDEWIKSHEDMDSGGVVFDYDEMYAFVYDTDISCEWNVEEVNVDVSPSKDKIKKAEQILADNDIDADEVAIVLQALGYALLDVELYPENLRI